jgi:hypothetical protein
MINFSLEPYEWQKDMDNIMQNVNLNGIKFLNDRSIVFEFLNSYNGNFYKKILCCNVWKFSEENSIKQGGCLPVFVCDVRIAKLKNSEIDAAFNYLKYGFSIPKCNEYNLLCMDSGDMSIALICETVEVTTT